MNQDHIDKHSSVEQSMVFTKMGEDHYNTGNIDDALKAFKKALKINPKNITALNNLGVASWHKGDIHQAIDSFQQVLKLEPTNEDAIHNMHELQKAHADDTCLRVKINGDILVCVPSSIEFMTPYILLEQEDWFEEEIHYIRKLMREGMKVIDIGANYGLYTLTMSKIIGSSGMIWAFEPTSLTADFLRKSIQTNGLKNITLLQAGLSDKKGTAKISLNANPELNTVTDEPASGGRYETVELLTLDECYHLYGWDNIDFIKLDAEGQEHNIIKGGKQFLTSQSPLIMFELKHGENVNIEIIRDFSGLGYQPYHLVPGINILTPIDLNKPFDTYQLNLFCCKTDRAKRLEEQGLLITRYQSPEPICNALWQQKLQALPYFKLLMGSWAAIEKDNTTPGWEHYVNSLNDYVMAHDEELSAPERVARLHRAWEESSQALESKVNVSRLVTHVRIQSALGKRGDSLQTINTILKLIESEKTTDLSEPFIPVSPRFDYIVPNEINKWLLASLLEYREKAQAFSSYFTGKSSLNNLELIKQLGYQTPEMERRRQIVRIRHGLQNGPISNPSVSKNHQDNLNPEFWDQVAQSITPHNIFTHLGVILEQKIRTVDIGAMDIGESQNENKAAILSRKALEAAERGALAEAITLFAQAQEVGVNDSIFHYNYATSLMMLGRYKEALPHLEQCTRLTPDYLPGLNNYAVTLERLLRIDDAETVLHRVLSMQPGHHEALTNLANCLKEQGRTLEAVELCRQALVSKPDYLAAGSNLLLCLHYHETDGRYIRAEHESIVRQIVPATSTRAEAPMHRGRGPGEKIRIGFVSPDLRLHSVAYFLMPLIAGLDRAKFHITCYSDTRIADSVTASFAKASDAFFPTCGLQDTELAGIVERDVIDVLIDLAGHTEGGRPGLYALRPAPVQCTYLGYPSTTGLQAMDWRITDWIADPAGFDDFYTERLFRLPGCFLCYHGSLNMSAVATSPAAHRGSVTFCSFNNAAKIQPETIRLWASVLSKTPGTRMVLKAKALSNSHISATIIEKFAREGIKADRIEIRGYSESVIDHMAMYADVDIALDTWPYNGTTTSCEALWMGVPVVSLSGSVHASRVGATILRAVGLGSLAVDTPAAFVRIAGTLAADIVKLARLRAGLRNAMSHSDLCNAEQFAKSFGEAIEKMVHAN